MTEDLQQTIDRLVENSPPFVLKQASALISKSYSAGQRSSFLFESEAARLAYLVARVPPIFGALCAVLRQLPISPASWLDLGAGPGTASWAVASVFPNVHSFTLIEKNLSILEVGKQLALRHASLKQAEWICASLPRTLPAADAAILSYVLGELKTPSLLVEKWWQADIPFLLVVEPGTPRGFSQVRAVREQIISLGGFLLAPCPHAFSCPLLSHDWCHFSARIARSRLHRYVKAAALGYEDEKYSYLIASKTPAPSLGISRILRHPQKQKGHLRFSVCNPKGKIEEITVSRKKQGRYQEAKRLSWGDALEEQLYTPKNKMDF